MEKIFYSPPQAAKEIGVSKQTIYNWIRKGKIYTLPGTFLLPNDLVIRLKDERNGRKTPGKKKTI